jgi:hypothetical protein
MTVGEARNQQNQGDDVAIKPPTRYYWNQIFVALLKAGQAWRIERCALAMKMYEQLRGEHSIAQARRVSFAPAVTEEAHVIAFPATA